MNTNPTPSPASDDLTGPLAETIRQMRQAPVPNQLGQSAMQRATALSTPHSWTLRRVAAWSGIAAGIAGAAFLSGAGIIHLTQPHDAPTVASASPDSSATSSPAPAAPAPRTDAQLAEGNTDVLTLDLKRPDNVLGGGQTIGGNPGVLTLDPGNKRLGDAAAQPDPRATRSLIVTTNGTLQLAQPNGAPLVIGGALTVDPQRQAIIQGVNTYTQAAGPPLPPDAQNLMLRYNARLAQVEVQRAAIRIELAASLTQLRSQYEAAGQSAEAAAVARQLALMNGETANPGVARRDIAPAPLPGGLIPAQQPVEFTLRLTDGPMPTVATEEVRTGVTPPAQIQKTAADRATDGKAVNVPGRP